MHNLRDTTFYTKTNDFQGEHLHQRTFNCLRNHFVLVSESKINLNFYKYNAITRIDSSYSFIKVYGYYFGNYDTLRKNFGNRSPKQLTTKNDELKEIVKISNPTVIGIIETKIYSLISDSEVSIVRYCVIPRDRNRKG